MLSPSVSLYMIDLAFINRQQIDLLPCAVCKFEGFTIVDIDDVSRI